MNGERLVEVAGLVRRYGALTAVDGLSFDVRRGEMFGLIGPDGAGKTTTLRVVLGLLAPHGGSVRTCGLDPLQQRRALSSRIGYLSQRFSLYGDLSVDENIAFFADIHGVAHWQVRRDELLEMVRMTPFRKRLVARLSGGMKQKLALACTLIHTPELLVLDEPTTGVDPVSRRDFWRLLSRLQREGLTLLLTTPYLDEAERCQRVALLDHGRLLTLDAPDALRAAEPGSMIEVVARPRRDAVALLRGRPGVTDVEVFGERAHVHLPAVPRERAEAAAGELQQALAAAGFAVDLIRPTTPSLEDVFIARLRASAPGSEGQEARP
ncbi:MAG: ABC transporter ATP-binding protein [Vicinamibacteria bacterium]|nr:ABC transporter ATP-binding protein [Vicinamibacteria bacterium]